MVSWEASLVAPEPLQQQESLDNPKVHSGLLGNRQARRAGRWSTLRALSQPIGTAFSSPLFGPRRSKWREKKPPTFPHIPLPGLCSAKSDSGFDYLVKSSSELHDLRDFAALFRCTLPTFSCANRSTWCWNLTFSFSLNSHTRSPLFLSVTHRGTKSRGSITAGGLGDILIPYYWVQD